jgi:hypothetical protein
MGVYRVPEIYQLTGRAFHRWRNQYGGMKAENTATRRCPMPRSQGGIDARY